MPRLDEHNFGAGDEVVCIQGCECGNCTGHVRTGEVYRITMIGEMWTVVRLAGVLGVWQASRFALWVEPPPDIIMEWFYPEVFLAGRDDAQT